MLIARLGMRREVALYCELNAPLMSRRPRARIGLQRAHSPFPRKLTDVFLPRRTTGAYCSASSTFFDLRCTRDEHACKMSTHKAKR